MTGCDGYVAIMAACIMCAGLHQAGVKENNIEKQLRTGY